jgi:hypothetical protein
MIEFVFVFPILLLLAFGTVDMGMAWVANNRVEGSASTAARIGASSGDDPAADANILRSLRASLPDEQLSRLDRVVVFKSATANGSVPGGCIKAVGSGDQTGVNGQCNTYSGATVRGVIPDNLGTADNFWLSTSRNDDLSDPPDYIGVWVRTTFDSKSGLFYDDRTITRQSIYRVQPDP